MRKVDIEHWALSVLDRVAAGHRVEDSRVEVKEQLTDSRKAARRIAGHANASHGEPILWLFGVNDATHQVMGVKSREFADWINAVKSNFDELAPEIEDLLVPYGTVTVLAIVIQTDRAPFVVKTGASGEVSREVPWREGTRINSATRSQVVRMLAPGIRKPEMEIVWASVSVSIETGMDAAILSRKSTDCRGRVFITQPQSQQSVLAHHKSRLTLEIGNDTIEIPSVCFCESDMHLDSDCISLVGPRYFNFRVRFGSNDSVELPSPHGSVSLGLRLGVAGIESPVIVEAELALKPIANFDGRVWEYGSQASQ